jgi:tRNA A37 methylthiotransferase MiaB
VAIGSHKSKPLNQCIEEFKNGLKKDYKFFLINADDIGAYGLDIGCNFPELLDKLTIIKGDYKIKIANLNPRWFIKFIDDLQEIFKRKKITHICIPIQSGNNRILKKMQRFSDTEQIKQAFQKLHKTSPEVLVSTHIMAGFPTETEEEFNESLSFIKKCNLNAGQVIPFSCKTNTKAETLNPKITDDEMIKRLNHAKNYLKNEGYNIIKHGYGTISFPIRSKIKAFLFEKKI